MIVLCINLFWKKKKKNTERKKERKKERKSHWMSSVYSKARDNYASEWRRTVNFFTASSSAFRRIPFPNKIVEKEDEKVR